MIGLFSSGGAGGVWELVLNAGPVAKLVLLILLAFSIVCWALIFQKARQFRQAGRETARFLKAYREARRFSVVAGAAKKLRASPLARVYHAAYQELGGTGNPLPDLMDVPAEEVEEGLSSDRLDPVERTMQRTMAVEVERMQRYLPFLATTASAAPFIGLFGTVWGIMNSFHAIGQMGSANLAVVAPGISEALIATAAGLAAAIPAVMAYNYFVNKVRRWTTEMDNFSLELLNLMERAFVRSGRAVRHGL